MLMSYIGLRKEVVSFALEILFGFKDNESDVNKVSISHQNDDDTCSNLKLELPNDVFNLRQDNLRDRFERQRRNRAAMLKFLESVIKAQKPLGE